MCPSRPSRHYLSPFAISDICLIIIKIICPKLKSRWSTRLNFKATQALLNIIYNGSATLPRLVSISLQNAKNRNSKVKSNFLSKRDEKLLESVMALLDVALPGELRSEVFIVFLHIESQSTFWLSRWLREEARRAIWTPLRAPWNQDKEEEEERKDHQVRCHRLQKRWKSKAGLRSPPRQAPPILNIYCSSSPRLWCPLRRERLQTFSLT